MNNIKYRFRIYVQQILNYSEKSMNRNFENFQFNYR